MKNIAVYPFTSSFLPMLDNLVRYDDSNKYYAVSSPCYGGEGKDISVIDMRPKLGVDLCNDFNSVLNKSDIVIIPDCEQRELMKCRVLQSAQEVLKKGKELHILMQLEEADVLLLEQTAKENKAKFSYLIINDAPLQHLKLLEIDVPVVFIAKTFKETNSTDTLIKLHDIFKKNGYTPLGITSERNCALLGSEYEIFPDVFGNRKLNETQKVVAINHFVSEMIIKHNPEIILLEMPDEMMLYNREVVNSFGIQSIMLSKAIAPDYLLLCTYLNIASDKFLDDYSVYLKYTLGNEIDATIVTNKELNFNLSAMQHKMVVLSKSEEETERYFGENISKNQTPSYYLHHDISMIYDDIVEKLA